MSWRRAAIIYNPAAGGGFQRAISRVREAAAELQRTVPEVELFATAPERRADVLVREAVDAGFDLICPCGGDGTINEAIQEMANSKAALLPLPAGTANVLARETGMPLDPVRAAQGISRLVCRDVELGTVELADGTRRHFLLMCGAGVDAGAVYRLNLGLKKRAGILAYVWSAGQQLFLPLERLHLQIGGERFEASLVVVSKSRLYGGQLELTPNANLLRRQFEVVCFETRSPMRYAARLAEALAGMLGRSRDVVWRHGREVDLAPAANSDVYVQVDGELVGSLPARIRMGPERIRLLLPQRYCDRSRDKNQPTGAPSVG